MSPRPFYRIADRRAAGLVVSNGQAHERVLDVAREGATPDEIG